MSLYILIGHTFVKVLVSQLQALRFRSVSKIFEEEDESIGDKAVCRTATTTQGLLVSICYALSELCL